MFSKKQKDETSKIGFSMKFQLGYLETQLFTTLGGGVKHGIQISIKITKFQVPTFFVFDELRHYTIFEKRVSLETRCFQKNKKLKHRKSDSPSNFS